MNFNTFFLDKLSSGDQSLSINAKKGSSAAGLFSDIIKVYEQEATGFAKESIPENLNAINSPSNTLTENIIECDLTKLQMLSQYIQNFMLNSGDAVKTPETVHDLQQVVISKKQFILPAGSMNEFLTGLIQKLEGGSGFDVKTDPVNKIENAGTTNIFNIDAKKIAVEEAATENGQSDKTVDKSALMHFEAAQSLLNFLVDNKNLNLTFKNGAEKINLSIRELPEDNIEAKIDFEKLSADFKKAGIFPLSNQAEYLLSDFAVKNGLESGFEKGTIDAGINSLRISGEYKLPNVYKTEVIEVSPKSVSDTAGEIVSVSNPKSLLDAGASQDEKVKIYNMEARDLNSNFARTGKLKYSGFLSAAADISNEGEMNNTLLKDQKKQEISGEKKFSPEALGINKAATDNPLLVRQDSPVVKIIDADRKELQYSNIRPANDESPVSEGVEILKNLLEKVDSIPQTLFAKRADMSGKNYNRVEGMPDAAVKSDSSFVSEFDIDSMDEFVRTATEELKKLSNEETILKKMRANEETTALEADLISLKQVEAKKNPAAPGVRVFGEEPETVPVAAQMNLKSNLNKDYSNAGNHSDGKKSAPIQENAGKKEQADSVQDKSTSEKASAEQKTSEGFKNILQNSDALNNINADKFKNAPEMKPLQESFKNIKASEIVNEFSKFIQSGEKQSMTFQLSPENLGKVKLIVDLIENQINTRIEVENENVKQFIQSNIEQLKQNLQSSGIHLSQLNISLSDSEQKSAKTFSRKKSGEKISRVEEDEVKTSPSQKTMGYNTYEFLA